MNAIDNNYGAAGRINAFDRRNGGKNASAVLGEWIYYSNGAKRECEPLGLLQDPPENEFERLTNIACFHQARLKQAIHQFDTLKEQLAFAVHPDGEALTRLKQLQELVSKRNAALEDAKQNLANTAGGKRRARSKEMDAEQRQRTQTFRDDVKHVRI